MQVSVDIQVVPFTGKSSVREELRLAEGILRATGLEVRAHPGGLHIQGDYDVIGAAIRDVHEQLHARGCSRVSSTLRISSKRETAHPLTAAKNGRRVD